MARRQAKFNNAEIAMAGEPKPKKEQETAPADHREKYREEIKKKLAVRRKKTIKKK